MPDTTSACLAEPPTDGPWGDCWCTLPTGHSGEHRCEPCTTRNHAPGWNNAPDWRDVIRAFLAIGPYLLERVSTGETTRWRYETDKRTNGLRELVDVFHYPTESIWLIKLGLHGDTHMVSLKNPTPAEVLTAARLVGLGGSDER